MLEIIPIPEAIDRGYRLTVECVNWAIAFFRRRMVAICVEPIDLT